MKISLKTTYSFIDDRVEVSVINGFNQWAENIIKNHKDGCAAADQAKNIYNLLIYLLNNSMDFLLDRADKESYSKVLQNIQLLESIQRAKKQAIERAIESFGIGSRSLTKSIINSYL